MEILLESAHRPDRASTRNRVLAAWLVAGGKRHAAYLYPDGEAERHYYHADGSSLERQFLKAPLNYSRISSGFSHSRLHPILGVHRPHYGVDYAAPIGTPVHATADGSVIRRGQDGGMGRYIVLRHPGKVETTYMHLSRFAPATSVGARVQKGQVIGAVGSSGMSTGPHLDYRVKVSGRFIDPRGFCSRAADPLPAARLPVFTASVARYHSLWAALAPAAAPEARQLASAAAAK
jgi:murein DD-endopeptidase MepM/ murein hydrolase activator NlpD